MSGPAVTDRDVRALVIARARALVGVRFRPQGRRPEHGLDCVGLVAAAAGVPGESVPSSYRLRGEVETDAVLRAAGDRVRAIGPGDAEAGDVLAVAYAAHQHHLLVLVEDGFVHADARLGRVVLTPGTVTWPVVAAWRVIGEN